ncbi:MAG: GDSL-type esterase/lipase family protein, partial [Ignavibacteriales bacterium]|nr:GDSL-type esterase/lipase family protein [Ignavibacteriales bacterium]
DNSPERVVSLSHPYEQILRRLRDTFPSAKICICTLLPAGGRYARLNESIRNFNSKLMELAQSTKTPVLDLYPMFSDGTGALKSTITTDGLHIVPAAYAPWIEKVKQFIAEVPGQ